jgi:hypothetical protein
VPALGRVNELLHTSAQRETMIDENSNRRSGAAGCNLSKNVQLHVIRLTLNQLDQQLMSMRESDGESVVEEIIDKSRTSTFVRTVVERELKRRDQGDQLFARVERMAQALSAADDDEAANPRATRDSKIDAISSIGRAQAMVARPLRIAIKLCATNLFKRPPDPLSPSRTSRS